ncbi:MAG: hypothetical protein K6A34_08130 [Methanobrevibacter sp.]|nr:hypothetical protein [Methanobrevibacter sp.]
MDPNFEELLSKYGTGRIDIKNYGTSNNKIDILENSDLDSRIELPGWFNGGDGEGVKLESSKGVLDLKIKCINDGVLKIFLRSPDIRDRKHQKFPIYIDYTNFSVNESTIFDENKLVTAFQPFVFTKNVYDSEVVKIHIQWLPFNSASEFNVIKSHDVIQALSEKLALREKQLKSIQQLSASTFGFTVLDGRLTYRNINGMNQLSVLDDFDGFCDNYWFTKFLKHKFPDEDFKINFFGVFYAHNNLAYPMEGKKVLYSMEDLNYRFLEMKYYFDKYALDYVDLAMGYDIVDDPKYLRFPFWFLRHISPESTEEDIEKKVESWNSTSYKKFKDVTVIASHDWGGTRTLIDNDINKFVNVLYAGRWKNNTSELLQKYDNYKHGFLKQFKFNICSENLLADAYVTEKIFDAIECDCIPLYAGGGNYLEPEVINPKAIIRWDGEEEWGCDPDVLKNARLGIYTKYPVKWVANDDRNADSVELFKNLLTDKKTYDEFKDQDVILNSGVRFIIKKLNDLEKHFERIIYS